MLHNVFWLVNLWRQDSWRDVQYKRVIESVPYGKLVSWVVWVKEHHQVRRVKVVEVTELKQVCRSWGHASHKSKLDFLGLIKRWGVGSLVQKDLIVLQLLQQHLSVVGDVDSLELFRRIIAMFKVHVLNDLVRADDLNDLESMVFFFFTFKYSSSIVDSLSVNFSKIFSDPILVKVVSHWSFSLQQHIILLPFSESDTVIPDLVFIIVWLWLLVDFIIVQA